MRIALATAAQYPILADDDRLLHEELKRRGIMAEPVIWDSGADWSRYDVIVIRSIWDYHLKHDRFVTWLGQLEESGARIHNPLDVLRWNTDKRYMLDLQARGVCIAPTRVTDRGSGIDLATVLAATGWHNYVVKPAVSSTGYQTWFGSAPVTAADSARFRSQSNAMDLLVQEFAAGVHDGERSFVFIDGEYVHCILKKAAGNEFRVHIEHGGTVERVSAPAADVEWARSVLEAWGEPEWTYARVDCVADASGPVLMELELLDPELFLAYNPHATDRLIQRIIR